MKVEIKPLRATLRHLAHPARRMARLVGSDAPFVCTVWETDPEPATGCGGDRELLSFRARTIDDLYRTKVPASTISPELRAWLRAAAPMALLRIELREQAEWLIGMRNDTADALAYTFSVDFVAPEPDMIPPEELWTRVDGRGLPIQPPLAPPEPPDDWDYSTGFQPRKYHKW